MSETETEINPERLRTHTLPEGIHEIGRIHILVLIVNTSVNFYRKIKS